MTLTYNGYERDGKTPTYGGSTPDVRLCGLMLMTHLSPPARRRIGATVGWITWIAVLTLIAATIAAAPVIKHGVERLIQ
jgi:hypothetical protein